MYVALEEGLFLYEAQSNGLQPILSEDIRPLTGTQTFVSQAPLNLVFVADFAKTPNASGEDRMMYPAIDTGYMNQNVYLFCASEGLHWLSHEIISKKRIPYNPSSKIPFDF